jgi:hypothetical protein
VPQAFRAIAFVVFPLFVELDLQFLENYVSDQFTVTGE